MASLNQKFMLRSYFIDFLFICGNVIFQILITKIVTYKILVQGFVVHVICFQLCYVFKTDFSCCA